MRILLQTPLLLCLSMGLATTSPAAGQELERALGATRKQKESLAPLIEVLAERIELQMVEVEAKVIKRVIRRALEVQLTAKAVRRYQTELTRLIAMDLGLDTSEELDIVSRMVASSYLRSPTGSEKLLALPARNSSPDSEGSLTPAEIEDQADLRLKTNKLLDGLACPPLDVGAFHLRCVRHDKSVPRALEAYTLARVDKKQAKGMRALAKLYGPQLAQALGSRRGLEFAKQLESTLGYENTGVAMAATLVKLRRLVRPLLYKEEGIKDKPREVCDAQAMIIDRVCTTLGEGLLWKGLVADHQAMLRDPKGHMARIKARNK